MLVIMSEEYTQAVIHKQHFSTISVTFLHLCFSDFITGISPPSVQETST